MKRFAAICTSLALVAGLLGGCGRTSSLLPPNAQEVSEVVSQPFDAEAVIRMGDMEAVVDLNKSEAGVFSFTFTEPKALSGMTVSMDDETVGLSYLGMHIEGDSEQVLNSSAVKAIVSALNQAAKPNGIEIGVEGTAITVSGDSESGKFLLTLDPRSRSMLTLSIPELELTCHFGGRS